jgi:uncharacterized protein (TIGR03435 family)
MSNGPRRAEALTVNHLLSAIAAVAVVAIPSLSAQIPRGAPAVETSDFERVVIKAHGSDDLGKSHITGDAHGGLTATNVTLRQLIVKAFGVRPERVAGGPDWVDTDRFDVEAIPAAGVGRVDANALARLLEDRFRLVIRWEPHRVPVYLLKRQKGGRLGRGIRPPSPGCEQTRRTVGSLNCEGAVGWRAPGWLFVSRGPVSSLARFLPSEVGREVLDQTGLKGIYDIDLKFAPKADSPFPSTAIPDRSTWPDIVSAIRDQLGFELEPSVAELPVQWIEGAERPQAD